jgi:D-alanyl-D-alanine carboxypeptidase/D-alanyl-D-alanine-endopeptidase (penicillin-binding protein 4)
MKPRAALLAASVVLTSCTAAGGGASPPGTGRPPPATDASSSIEADARALPTRTAPTPPPRRSPLRTARWGPELRAIVGDAPMSVSVAVRGRLRFSHLGGVRRPPASNEKLLLSMALLDRFGPRARIPTTVTVDGRVRRGVVHGDVWIVGHGDPEVDDATIARLADELASDGIVRVEGSVAGDTSEFRRDRWATGWHRIALSFVSVPTALVFDDNEDRGRFVFDPERRAAAALTADLRRLGVGVTGRPTAGAVPETARTVARVPSAPLVELLRRQNAASSNLDAEVLGKRLGEVVVGRGSIAAGARAIRAWAREHGVRLVAHDASGLSYANRVSTDDVVRLLSVADGERWGGALRSTLPRPGLGTLRTRLAGLDVRAKTGTLLEGVSALSGWVRTRSGGWAAFSILSEGMAKDTAVALEDEIVRFLASHA